MDDSDAERIRIKMSSHWRPYVVCHCCAGPPTCPQLQDDLWRRVWATFVECAIVVDWPTRSGDLERIIEHRGTSLTNQMLCLECAERVLGRELTLDDLLPCVGNYAHYVMQRRAVRETDGRSG